MILKWLRRSTSRAILPFLGELSNIPGRTTSLSFFSFFRMEIVTMSRTPGSRFCFSFLTFLMLCLLLIQIHPVSALQISPDGFDPAAASKEAEAAMNNQDFGKAVSIFREIDNHYPDIPGVKMNLGMALYLDGKPAEALESLMEAAKKDPSLERAWFFSAMSCIDLNRPDEAVTYLEEYLKRKPIDYDARQIYADTLSSLERYEDAVKEYQKVLKGQEENPKAWYGIGRAFEALSNHYFDRLDELAPESGYWLALVADSRMVQKQFSSAFFLYRQALEDIPDLRGVHFSISRIYRERGEDEWARIEEQKESELGVPDCEKEKLVCYFLQGAFSRIVEEGDTDKPEDLYWMIQAYNQLAVASFSMLNELPSSYEVHALRAQVEENLGRFWESSEQWRKALEFVPGDPFVRRQLAINLYFNRDYDGADEIVQELLAKNPADPMLNYLAGDILVYEQQAEEAIPYLERSVKGDDSYIPAHSSLGRAYMSLGKAAEAIPHLKKALVGDGDGSIHYQLARAYQQAGEPQEARELMKQYQEIRRELEAEERELSKEVKITAPDYQ